jgi:hypothetical protein
MANSGDDLGASIQITPSKGGSGKTTFLWYREAAAKAKADADEANASE